MHEGVQIPHLHCFLVMRSLKSRGFLTEIFSWQWHYYFLTKEGVNFLREYLGLPSNVVPNTHRVDKTTKREDEEGVEAEGEGRDERRTRGRGGRGRGRGGRGGRTEEAHAEA
jgi:small subunit ribosomal protein S10e